MKEDWINAESSGNVNKMMSNAKIGRTLAFISIVYTPITIFLYIIVEVLNLYHILLQFHNFKNSFKPTE